MGTLRINGRIQQSDIAPENVFTGVIRPSRLFASDGVTNKQLNHVDSVAGDLAGATANVTPANGDIFEIPFYARGDETVLDITNIAESTNAIWELYLNGNLEPVWSTIDTAGKFYVDDGGVFSDDTVDAGDAGAGDVDLLPAIEAINDAAYFGWGAPFRGIRVDIGTPGVGGTGTWEYWNGAWVALTCTDGSIGFTAAAGNHDVTFTPPSDWVANDPGGVATENQFYVRFRVTAANFTTIPVLDQVWINGGYNDYAAAITVSNREITLVNGVLPGYNLFRIIITGRHYSSTNYYLEIGGLSIQ